MTFVLKAAPLVLGFALLAMVAPRPASAQEPASSTLIEEVEVIAKLPGPALWRVSTPTSQLWIVGLSSPLPPNFSWDKRRLETALAGARELVLPPSASVGLGDMLGLMVDPGHVIHLDKGQTLRAGLPEPLRIRFDAAAQSVGQDPAHYDHWRPVFAAMALVFDATKTQKLDPKGAEDQIADLARRRGVRVRQLATYKAADLVRSFSRMGPEGSDACMTLAVTTAETIASTAPRMAQAWARGDVATVNAIDASSSPDTCLEAAPEVAALRDRVATDWAADLSQALARPGKTVVAVDMTGLTRKGGLLDQLRAKGLAVIGPAY
jgi:uncharacterized protein YbaP (TraB family)